MPSISLSGIFQSSGSSKVIQSVESKRSIREFEGSGQLVIDQFEKGKCAFLRLNGHIKIELLVDNPYQFKKIKSGGYLGTPIASNQPYLWFPDLPKKRQVNVDNYILGEELAPLDSLSWDSENSLSFQICSSGNSVADGIIWQFDDDFSVDEIISLLPIESHGYFLWGSHGCIKKPADLYRHLINGAVYDLRYSWPHKKKCFSENEAHALYTIFSGLEKATGKSIYRNFQQQLVLSLIQRQSEDGGWYHGMWTDNSECHYRLSNSALHLLMDEFARTGCSQIKQTLAKGVTFLCKTVDSLDCGTWFLHDSLELSEQAMNAGPFKWIPNRTLGKKTSNMLVLNTHLDSTIAINRYSQLTGDLQYQEIVASALNSTQTVLSLQPANWLYKPLFWAIGLTMLPTEKASQLPLPVRLVKRLAWQYMIKKLPDIKAKYPRLVMPNGYIDRELSLRTWAIDYQTINLMDLARHAYAFPQAFDETILDKAIEFTQTSGLIKRYRELTPGKRYAVGFWAEALYYRCLTKSERKYRYWLAEAMLECDDLDFGMAPSLLGGNGEAVQFDQQIPCPAIDDPNLLIANLSHGNHLEYLVVNTSVEIVTIQREMMNHFKPALDWYDDKNNHLISPTLTVTGRSCLIAINSSLCI